MTVKETAVTLRENALMELMVSVVNATLDSKVTDAKSVSLSIFFLSTVLYTSFNLFCI